MQEWNKKRKVMRFYDHLAAVYDVQYSEEQNAKIKVALHNTKLGQNGSILDMGCGTGLLFEHITKSARLLVGIDASSQILKKAKKRIKRLPNTFILRADADYTPFQNQTFDHIFAITLLQNMPKPVKTVQEMIRISKQGSSTIITGLKKKFSQRGFTELLKNGGLKISTFDSTPQIKGHLAICKTSAHARLRMQTFTPSMKTKE